MQIDAKVLAALPGVAAHLGHALALITGRSITGVDRLFPQLRLPMAGQHGSERRDADGTSTSCTRPGHLCEDARLLQSLADRHAGVFLEDKGNTLALHYREAPQLAGHVHRVLRSTRRGHRRPLDLQPGKWMLEVRPGSRDKGTAIADFMSEAPLPAVDPYLSATTVPMKSALPSSTAWADGPSRSARGARLRVIAFRTSRRSGGGCLADRCDRPADERGGSCATSTWR